MGTARKGFHRLPHEEVAIFCKTLIAWQQMRRGAHASAAGGDGGNRWHFKDDGGSWNLYVVNDGELLDDDLLEL